ncbi:MAG: AAA family ATPase [Firmicutes bacterium]|nr:AAA family ATPase [Bacillota bacterium]
MVSEPKKVDHDQQVSFEEKVSNPLTQLDLEVVINHSYDVIFVTDGLGNVIFANTVTKKLLGVSLEKIIGSNVKDLLEKGVYNWSPTLKALEKRTVVTGLLESWHGIKQMVTSTPLMDENGDVVMVITNSRHKKLVDKYIEAIKKEKATADRYKTAVTYLSEKDLKQNLPVAKSQQMREIMAASQIIAKTDSTVVLIGESGTGKEVMAKYIHGNSLRAKEPFIPVNCAAIPQELMESEFFGYVRGAFTGASTQGKPGLFEIADKGTLFLDEISELPLSMQSKLLRVLETGEIQRLGSTTMCQTNVRLIAATNRDLKEMINQKTFRSDLYYRLNVIPIHLPPLRERPDDILALANKFLEELNRKYAFEKNLTTHAIAKLLEYSWPGNVRELRNVIERLVITSAGDDLYFGDNYLENNKICLDNENSLTGKNSIYKGTLKSVLKAVEMKYIKQVLAECDGRVGEAANRLGIHRTVLYRKTRDEQFNKVNLGF